jgi:hypothetical protein
MSLPSPKFRIAPLPEGLQAVKGYRGLQTFFPAMAKLYKTGKHKNHTLWFDCKWRIHSMDLSGSKGPCLVSLGPNVDCSGGASNPGEGVPQPAFVKVTHLLDPCRWMQGKYTLPKDSGLPCHSKSWAAAWQKLQDPCNQAYVETIAAYALGRLREENVSPHFNAFYGAFCAKADAYQYNLSDDFQSYRHEGWFWHGRNKGLFDLRIVNRTHPDKEIPEEVLSELLDRGSVVSESDSESDETSESEQEEEEEVLEPLVEEVDAGSIKSGGDSDLSFAEESEDSNSDSDSDSDSKEEEDEDADDEESEDDDDSEEDEEDDEDAEEEDDYQVYCEIQNFPVMMIVVDKNEGTMDELLDNTDMIGSEPGTDAWDLQWSAWLFQILAALSVAQCIFGFTHNDLHTNNIVWTKTEEEFLYYRSNAGAVFKVPTYGKLFKIIDFGRAIFSINGRQFISDDFKSGNDADGQYSFSPLVEDPDHVVPPNPSFDLCRLSVSLFEALFPFFPEAKEGAAILSSEEELEVKESSWPLFNCMWKWMLDDRGENVLINSDGSEKFPDFDLYSHIAEHIHKAVPSQQFSDPAFDRFQVEAAVVEGKKCWSLFC